MKLILTEKCAAPDQGPHDKRQLREIVLALPDARHTSVRDGDTVLEALAAMEESGGTCLVVLNGTGLAGILTAEDCAFKILLEGKDPGKMKCSDIMRKAPYCADANMDADECLDFMGRHGIDQAVVSFGGYPVGLVTPTLLLQSICGRDGGIDERPSATHGASAGAGDAPSPATEKKNMPR